MSGNTSQIKKMKQGMSYTIKEKIIIMNVFKYFHQEYPDLRITEIVRRTARATGCSEKSIFQFRKEETSIKGFKEPSKTKIRKNLNINSREIKYDNEIRQTIRNIIYDLRNKNVVPSLNTVLKQLRSKNDIPKFSLMTLRRLLFDMGFYYEKNGSKCTLVENPDDRFHVIKPESEASESHQKSIENCVKKPLNESILQANHILESNSKYLEPENIMPTPTQFHEIQPLHSASFTSSSHSWWIPPPNHHYECVPPASHYGCVPVAHSTLHK